MHLQHTTKRPIARSSLQPNSLVGEYEESHSTHTQLLFHMLNRRKGTTSTDWQNNHFGTLPTSSTKPVGSLSLFSHIHHDKSSSVWCKSRRNYKVIGLFIMVVVLFLNHDQDRPNNKEESSVPLGVNNNDIPRFSVADPNAMERGSQEPVLLEGWTLPDDGGDWTKKGLMERVGHFPQYLKDLTVQPLKHESDKNQACVVPGWVVAELLVVSSQQQYDLLFFTNNQENEAFMKQIMPPATTTTKATTIPRPLQHITGFQVFSAVGKNKSHSFHRHGESWLGQLQGRRQWWFLPPSTSPPPPRVNACDYLTGQATLPPGTTTILQESGQIIWFPKDWYHATCALDEWTLGIGAQQGRTIRQSFEKLEQSWMSKTSPTTEQIQTILRGCIGDDAALSIVAALDKNGKMNMKGKFGEAKSGGTNHSGGTSDGDNQWKWFDGDLNAYYNSLEKDHNRDPNKISDYAVHRWLGPKRSTEEQYRLLDEAATLFLDPLLLVEERVVHVLDGGCGLGSGLMWMEQQHPTWKLTGYTVSEEQYKFIEKLPVHNFQVHLQSYDELKEESQFDFIYSIEALIHSLNATHTLEVWAKHLKPGGILAILDDFVVGGPEEKETEEMQEFAKSWLANSLFSTQELGLIGKEYGLEVVQERDLTTEFNIIGLNYQNKVPEIHPFGGRVHQGWMGSKWRQRLTVERKLTYNLLVMKKPTATTTTTTIVEEKAVREISRRMSTPDDLVGETTCAAVPSKAQNQRAAQYTMITPQLMSGRGKDGGEKMACISGWYCCNKGTEWWDRLDKNRTDNTAFLKLDRNLFGHYIDSFTKHLNDHYATHPESIGGRFLDIGGTGSTASGMTQVTSKFQHFAGPLEYWKLDSDPGADGLERTLYCDIEDCPSAETCGFDVTFSHTVLEHATRPWLAFDTISRITKQGGLTMHLVPFSYQYHATPDDNYRFSHKALVSLLEDRGFEVLEVGYDICTKPNNMLRRVDEHFDTIWLTYVIGRKL